MTLLLYSIDSPTLPKSIVFTRVFLQIICTRVFLHSQCTTYKVFLQYQSIYTVSCIKYFYNARVFIHNICTKYLYSISTLNSSNIHHITHQQKKTTPVTILYAADITQQPKKTTLYSSKDKNEFYFEAFLSGILFSFRRAELSPLSVRFKPLSTHFIFSENSNINPGNSYTNFTKIRNSNNRT